MPILHKTHQTKLILEICSMQSVNLWIVRVKVSSLKSVLQKAFQKKKSWHLKRRQSDLCNVWGKVCLQWKASIYISEAATGLPHNKYFPTQNISSSTSSPPPSAPRCPSSPPSSSPPSHTWSSAPWSRRHLVQEWIMGPGYHAPQLQSKENIFKKPLTSSQAPKLTSSLQNVSSKFPTLIFLSLHMRLSKMGSMPTIIIMTMLTNLLSKSFKPFPTF